jgi:signal transduction histidine kinase
MVLSVDLPGSAGWSPLARAINLASLGLLVWGITSEARPGLGGPHLAALILLIAAVGGWLSWTVTRQRPADWPGLAALAVMALAGGALVVFAPLALVFPAVAALGATIGWPLPAAFGIAAGGWAAMFVSVAAAGHSPGVAFGGLAASCAGMVVGISRRRSAEQVQQAALVAVETERAEVARQRAELLAERNHLARELHDVLAHTLAALSLQLEAFGTVIDADSATSPAVRHQLERTRHLVREGLNEARGAVRALRDDAAPLESELARLSREQDARFELAGEPRAVPPPVALALYRVTQEALTNAMKHAAGAPVCVRLEFAPGSVRLLVDNGPAADGPAPIAASGGGYGLPGIAERLTLLGGRVEAGPSAHGWRVAAEVPA